MKTVVICDFDETIVDVDTGILILEKYGHEGWKYYDTLYNTLVKPVEEVLRLQFQGVTATKAEMLATVEGRTNFRPGFDQMLKTLDSRGVPFVVVSYGLDFCISHFLAKKPLARKGKVIAPKTKLTPRGIEFGFPRRRRRDSVNIKDDAIRYYASKGFRVLFVGDGASDLEAAKVADASFAVEGSRLAQLCGEFEVPVVEIKDFGPVTQALAKSTWA